MPTTLNKLDYLDETKQQIKNALNTKFNSQIQDADTFRSYVSKISNIYTNWPKVTSENTSLSLTPTKKGLMALNLKGNTSQSGTPTPETPQDIHVVSGDNEIVVTGKNLFNKDDSNMFLKNLAPDNAGKVIATNTNIMSSNFISSLIIKCESNTTYTIQKKASKTFYLYDSEEVPKKDSTLRVITVKNPTTNKFTFTTDKTAKYIIYKFYNTWVEELYSYDEIVSSIQVEKGSTATDYEPYIGKSYPIYLGDIELCKIGDYQDYIYKDNNKWYIHKEIGKVVLNGTENWVENPVYKGLFILTKPDIIQKYNNIYVQSDKFLGVSNDNFSKNILTIDNSTTNYGNTRLFIAFRKYQNNLSEFKTWLSTHNTTVYYVLATPTYTEITDSTLISQLEALKIATSYDTQTNITQTNDNLPFIINASALMKGGK